MVGGEGERDTIASPRMRINLKEPKTEYVTLFHASPRSNRRRILNEGIRARQADYYKKLATRLSKEYEIPLEDIPTKHKRSYAYTMYKNWLNRYKYRAASNRVHTSSFEGYAVANSLAGKEAETELREVFELIKTKRFPTERQILATKVRPPGPKRQIDIYKLSMPVKDLSTTSFGAHDVTVQGVISPERIKSVKTASRWDEYDLPYYKKQLKKFRRKA